MRHTTNKMYLHKYTGHALYANRVMKPSTYIMHVKLILISVQIVLLHIDLPTVLPSVRSLHPSLPAPPSPRYEGGYQFHSHGTAIFNQLQHTCTHI